jgi:hypothetical protein
MVKKRKSFIMKKLVKTPFLALLILLAMSCKKEKPEVPNEVDPCLHAQPTTGDFLIEERSDITVNAKYTLTDTVFYDKGVRFTALQDDAEYTWYIGTEVLHSQSIERFFGSQWSNADIPITLVTRKKPNTLCFPDDTGYDSITKTFHVSHLPNWSLPNPILGPIEGNFRVKSAHLPDSFDINIDITYHGGEAYFNITNYDGLGSNCIQQARPSSRNYRQWFGFYGVGVNLGCDYMTGDVHIRLDNIVEMNFTFWNHQTNSLSLKRQYLGKKI